METPPHLACRCVNSISPFARLYRTDGGAVLLEAHCTLEDLDEVKLRTTVELAADLAEKVGPWMRDFFGAGSHSDGRDSE
jgi:hypothetical protein